MDCDASSSTRPCLTQVSPEQEGIMNIDLDLGVAEMIRDKFVGGDSGQIEGNGQEGGDSGAEEAELALEAGNVITERRIGWTRLVHLHRFKFWIFVFFCSIVCYIQDPNFVGLVGNQLGKARPRGLL